LREVCFYSNQFGNRRAFQKLTVSYFPFPNSARAKKTKPEANEHNPSHLNRRVVY
jgi:hypothetical protein